MAITYKKIASVTVGSGGATEIDFQNIPQNFTDLVVKMSTRDTITGTGNTWQAFDIYFNNLTTNRSQRFLFGTGSSSGSGTGATEIYGQAVEGGATANTFANGEIYIPNYTASTNKSISIDQVTENNGTAALVYLTAGLWSSTAAINRITLDANNYGTSFAQYSTATLYGISNS